MPGITLDCDGDGQYGMVVTEVSEGGAVAKDGRLKPGDLVLSLNYENLRRVTPAQARAILRRAQLITTDIKWVERILLSVLLATQEYLINLNNPVIAEMFSRGALSSEGDTFNGKRDLDDSSKLHLTRVDK